MSFVTGVRIVIIMIKLIMSEISISPYRYRPGTGIVQGYCKTVAVLVQMEPKKEVPV